MSAQTLATGAAAKGRFAITPDLELSWQCRGIGPELVLINNFFMDAEHWRAATSRLGTSHRIITYDLRNQGASGRSGPGSTWEDHVSDLAALLEHLELTQPYLLGTSDSALLARDFALRHPARVRGLILVGPTFSPAGGERLNRITKTWIDALDAQGPAAFFEMSYPLVFGDQLTHNLGALGYQSRLMAFLTHCNPEELREGLELVLHALKDPCLLTKISSPTLLMVGDDDFTIGVSGAVEIARMIPKAQLIVMPNSGHLPYIDATERFETEVAAFIAEVERADK